MTGWRSPAAVVLAGLLVSGTPAAAAAAPVTSAEVDHRTLFRFADRDILESSGLVDAGSVVHTMNDSGAGPLLYAVDPATGETTGVTAYTSDAVVDVEALAPAGRGDVWVGDIGDNFGRRASVSVYRVRPGGGQVPGVGLTYPGGARDAEALLAHPMTGRLYVVSKTVFGGVVYEAPRSLRPGTSHRLRTFARVPGLVTDGAFFPDGRHVLLRSYGTASVFTVPGFDLRGTVTLPAQRQGEGVSVGRAGRILLSSEGLNAPVLEVELPAALADEVAPAEAPPSAGRSPSTGPAPSAEPSPVVEPGGAAPDGDAGPAPGWILGGAGLLAVLAALTWTTRRRP
ncbi:MAG: hypothetical protein ACXWW7_06620 [Nocardioides sp.]